MQRIAWLPLCFALATLAGCQSTEPTPRQVNHPPRQKMHHVNHGGRPPVRAHTYYPPLEPLPPRQVRRNVRPQQPRPQQNVNRSYSRLNRATVATNRGIDQRRWQAIVVHHSATKGSTPQGMDRFHRQERGWKNGLGYHFVIGNGVNYPDGKIFASQRWKRQISGAHCRNRKAGRYFGKWRPANFFNTNAIGICLIGDFTKSGPTYRQRQALEELLVLLCNEAAVSPNAVHGHGEVTGKTVCPGPKFSISQVRRGLASRFRGGAVYASQGSG